MSIGPYITKALESVELSPLAVLFVSFYVPRVSTKNTYYSSFQSD